MKLKSLLFTGAIVATLLVGYQNIANAKDTTTYQAKTKKVTLYRSLPKSKHTKTNQNYRLSGNFSAKLIKTAKGQKYALLAKNNHNIGWFKLNDLKKITTNTSSNANKSTSNDDNNTTTSNDDQSTSNTIQTNMTTNSNPDAPIANMDYSYSASNNPSSTVSSLMKQTGVNWDDPSVQSAAAQAAFNAINNVRTDAGIQPLTINDELTKIAQSRIKQLDSNFTHYDSNGTMIALDNANQMGLNISNESTSLSENLGKSFVLDSDAPVDAGNRIIDSFQAEGPETHNGQEHGHYEADMDSSNKEVGVSFYHVPNTNDTYLAVEFGNYIK
ncbi:CAP domain-containing protein [Lactobacillaceae bacterium Melli_B4]